MANTPLMWPLLVLWFADVAATPLVPSFFQNTLDTFFPDHYVRIVDNTLIHVHKVCLQGGQDGLVVPYIDEAERVLRKKFPQYLPNASWPLPFRQFTRNEISSLFMGHEHVPNTVWS
jgi:hypothetical protein